MGKSSADEMMNVRLASWQAARRALGLERLVCVIWARVEV